MDEGYKQFLRGCRNCIKTYFLGLKLSKGFYHWNNERLLMKIRQFMHEHLPQFVNPDDNEVLTLAIWLCPTRINSDLFSAVSHEVKEFYKKLFGNNSSSER